MLPAIPRSCSRLYFFALVLTASVPITLAQKPAGKLQVPENVAFETDIEYSHPDGQHLQLNLARPKPGAGPFPAVLCIHGGGFRAQAVRR